MIGCCNVTQIVIGCGDAKENVIECGICNRFWLGVRINVECLLFDGSGSFIVYIFGHICFAFLFCQVGLKKLR